MNINDPLFVPAPPNLLFHSNGPSTYRIIGAAWDTEQKRVSVFYEKVGFHLSVHLHWKDPADVIAAELERGTLQWVDG